MTEELNQSNFKANILNFRTNRSTEAIVPVLIVLLFVSTMLYQMAEKINVAWILIILMATVLLCAIAMLISVKSTIRKLVENEAAKSSRDCGKCAADYEKLLLSHYGIVTFAETVERERALSTHSNPAKCKVYNYTTLDDTYDSTAAEKQETIKQVISNNISRGVNYKIFFTNTAFHANEDNAELYGGMENIIYCETGDLYRNASFDILLHITPEKKHGYMAVNFTSTDGKCVNCERCNYTNDDVVYKELPSTTTKSLFNQLNQTLKRVSKA